MCDVSKTDGNEMEENQSAGKVVDKVLERFESEETHFGDKIKGILNSHKRFLYLFFGIVMLYGILLVVLRFAYSVDYTKIITIQNYI